MICDFAEVKTNTSLSILGRCSFAHRNSCRDDCPITFTNSFKVSLAKKSILIDN